MPSLRSFVIKQFEIYAHGLFEIYALKSLLTILYWSYTSNCIEDTATWIFQYPNKTYKITFNITRHLIDLNKIFPMKPSKFKISIPVKSYQNCYVAEKRIVSKLSKISIPNFNSTNWKFDFVFKREFDQTLSTDFNLCSWPGPGRAGS